MRPQLLQKAMERFNSTSAVDSRRKKDRKERKREEERERERERERMRERERERERERPEGKWKYIARRGWHASVKICD